ncbi:hypothetical protein [Aquimarina rubra]|uniref:DUF4252 domain-containing protein n=1 Tax=Aquimarina rubra TaxID=1920033 RepID=A0ABW5LDG8_9FLAO
MKIFLNIIIFLIFTISFSQKTSKKTEYQIDLENSVECIDATLMLPDSDLLIAIIDENTGVADDNPEHFYIKANSKKIKSFVDVLAASKLLNEMYIIPFNEEYAYKEVNSGKVNDGRNVRLFIQISYTSPCHNDELFILVSDKNSAEKLSEELLKLFDKNKGLLKLNKQIKT